MQERLSWPHWRAKNIAFAVVTGLPAGYALDLEDMAPDLIVPVWNLCRVASDWSRRAYDREVLKRAQAALSGGRYRGIGALHLVGGFVPDLYRGVFRPRVAHTEPRQLG